jgi:ceramide glucosyltransferase
MALAAAYWLSVAGLAVLTAGLWACLAASVRLFRRGERPAPALEPMSLIKPLKGLDEGLEALLDSIAASDPEGKVQVVFAVESESDPAHSAAQSFAARHPRRDTVVAVTGPSRGRMGKAHNMIEALPRARHGRVVFSDSDVETTPELLAETSRAFGEGYEAVFAVPRQKRGPRVQDVLFEIAMNHSFALTAPLGWRFVGFSHCAGAWMGYTRPLLERLGGLEPIAHQIADDFALSQRAARAGARGTLLAAPVIVAESDATALETLRHLVKWSRIIRWSLPVFYVALPLLNIAFMSAAALALAYAGGGPARLAWGAAGAAFLSRGAVALLHDRLVGEGALPWPWYAALAFTDVGALAFWLAGFRREIRWRGVRYRLSWGGRAEVLASP